MYRTDLGYLQRIRWVGGTAAYCKRCDASVPMYANDRKMLECSSKHETHPAQVIVSGELRQ